MCTHACGLRMCTHACGAHTGASAIVVVDDGCGELARLVAAHRPECPIVALNPSLKVCRQLSISRGVYAHLVPEIEPHFIDPQLSAVAAASAGVLEEGERLVLMLGDSVTAMTYWDDDDDEFAEA